MNQNNASALTAEKLGAKMLALKSKVTAFSDRVAANEKAAARSPSKLRLLVEELGATIASVKDELDVRHYSVHLDGLLSRTMTMLSSFASTQASRLAGRASLPEPKDFLQALKASFPSERRRGCLDISAFGKAFSALVFDAPAWGPLLGPLSIAPKQKKVVSEEAAAARRALAAGAARPARDTAALTELSEQTRIARAEAQNANRARRMHVQLLSLQTSRPDLVVSGVRLEEVDGVVRRPLLRMIPTLFDGWSYTQTVENLFYFSFLVKQGLAGVFMEREHASGAAGEPLIAVYSLEQIGSPDLMLEEDDDEAEDEDAAAAGGMRRMRVARKALATDASRAAPGALAFRARQFIVHIDLESYARIVAVDNFLLRSRSGRPYSPALDHYHSEDSKAPPGWAFTSKVVVAGRTGAAGVAEVADAACATGAVGRKRARSAAAAAADDETEEEDDRRGVMLPAAASKVVTPSGIRSTIVDDDGGSGEPQLAAASKKARR